jgi:hypothetical protein
MAKEEIKINDGHYLELMDRIHVVMCTINDHCLEHPLTQSESEIETKINDAISLLYEAYQLVGNKSPEFK